MIQLFLFKKKNSDISVQILFIIKKQQEKPIRIPIKAIFIKERSNEKYTAIINEETIVVQFKKVKHLRKLKRERFKCAFVGRTLFKLESVLATQNVLLRYDAYKWVEAKVI